MDFRILDASAFYAGVPFRSSSDCYTTSQVYDEIKHIKKNQDALGTLLETNRLKIREPDENSTKAAISAAKDTGDYPQLSKQDLSIIALCIELEGEIISDDFAISNVAKNLGLKISPIMTQGIRDVGRWVHYCPGCKTDHKTGKECPMCATPLKRKLLKE
ncbi:nucleotide binding protein [Candidatus Nitrosopumilus koreensis AR1]|uniref:Endoribonuclease Nob1 n=1 Tax=Candidatus Nitrosopumilus koreensis AR1 TaxID=1229908 RepID=K0B5G4_9ARCH|nr:MULTISPECIES: nucleotide-binding protein [Nitrosopumilus]AFS80337.1 nucleotide binding protein [Candidatus Nitrosopumilus koreensis AR1]